MSLSDRAVEVTREVRAPAAEVWRLLADGWLYPLWVVGTARMRAVDEAWPAVGARLHHSVGNWPLLLDDRTEVLESEPGHRLLLRAHAWPMGSATVLIELESTEVGTRVRIREDAEQGPGTMLPRMLRQRLVEPRNREALRRLGYLAEGGRGGAPVSGPAAGPTPS